MFWFSAIQISIFLAVQSDAKNPWQEPLLIMSFKYGHWAVLSRGAFDRVAQGGSNFWVWMRPLLTLCLKSLSVTIQMKPIVH